MGRILTLVLVMIGLTAVAQTPNAGAEVVAQLLESLSEEGISVDDNEEIQALVFMASHHINLNATSREKLEQLFFLTDIQIENLQYYLYAHGPMLTLFELQAVEGFNEKTIQRLLPFVCVEQIETTKPTQGLALARAQLPLQRAAGYEPDGAYLGNSQKLFARTVIETPQARVGAAIEKDAGEPVFSNGISTIDHTSAFVELYPKKIATKWIIGDYRLSFGHGLAMSTGISMGKSAAPTSIRPRYKTLHGYASSDETRYLRGTSAEMPIGKYLILYPFASYRQVDGTMADDSSSVLGLSTTGLHRTKTEIARRHNMAQTLVGGAAKISFNKFYIQTGGYNYAISKSISTNDQLYKQLDNINQPLNFGFIAYTAMLPKTVVSGEWAMMQGGRSAVSQLLTWEPDGKFALSVRYQYFSIGYMAPYSAPGSRYGDSSGETNIYAGFQIRHNRKLESNGYTYFYKSRWLRYMVDAPSEGFEGMWRTHFSPTKSFIHYAQVKWRHSQRNILNIGTPDFGIEQTHQYNWRWEGQYTPMAGWRFNTRAELSQYATESGHYANGFYLHQDIGYKSPNGKWAVDARYGVFSTDDYNSRIYVYEPDVRYAFSVPALSGQGTRTVMVFRWSPLRQWDIYARWSNIKYADRQQSGSGYDTVDDDARNEMKFQIIYTFWTKRSKPKGLPKTEESQLED